MALLNPAGDKPTLPALIRLAARWLHRRTRHRRERGGGDLARLSNRQLHDLALTRRKLARAGIRLDTWPFGI